MASTTLETQSNVYESSNPTRTRNCPRKRIIVACDGTWMDSDGVEQVPSNITRIVRAIPPVGIDHSTPSPTPIPQITFYQNGIGTGSDSWYVRYVDKYVSGATGDGLAANIREAYNFICVNYHRGDEIILLGFSRGAFTARSISTLIKQLGLLTPRGLEYLIEICDDWEHQLSENWTTSYPESPFKDRPSFATAAYHEKLQELKLTRQNIPVKCVGVWDTVGSLGIPSIALFPQKQAQHFTFVDTRVEDNIEYAFHALGLDERRRSYAPTIWFKPEEQKLPKTLKQTWFPGVHSDIGGSYNNDDIANITLAWMVGQMEENKIVTFNREYIVGQVHATIRRHAREQESLSDAEAPRLERAQTFGPVRYWGLGKIHNSYSLFFRIGGAQTRKPMEHPEISRTTMKPTGRLLRGTGETMHASVRVRMALGGRGYDDQGDYESEALEGWKYEFEAYSQPDTPYQLTQPGEVGRLKNVSWVKFDDKEMETARMPEDKMTEFERIILRHWTAAEDNWEEGAEDREALVDSARPTRRESGNMELGGSRRIMRQTGVARRMDSLGIPEENESDEQSNGDGNGGSRRRRLSIHTDMQR